MKTYVLKQKDIIKQWRLLDADGLVLGRLSAHIAQLLRGKHKPDFAYNLDCGDNVVVINASKVRLTGNKMKDKKFYWHTGFPGGIKEINPKDTIAKGHPERLIMRAVKRMLPSGPMGRQQLSNLRVFAGPEHDHASQSPKLEDFKSASPKNSPRAR